MNSLELRENRKKMGLTQEELAKRAGVARKTIINYEKGEVIPESKRELFNIIFNVNNSDLTSKIYSEPEEKNDYEKKIQGLEERITEIKEIIKLINDENAIDTKHYNEMIKLLIIQIGIIRKAMKNDI
jgi:transcriptional regulator with XRE-family HTH domain